MTVPIAPPGRVLGPQRITYIDGLRGWAALSVLLFHLCWEVMGVRFPHFRDPWFTWALDGPLAVYVFFVLSGDALASPFLPEHDVSVIQRQALLRYVRLTLPIAMACSLTYLLMVVGWVFHREAAVLLDRTDWLGRFLEMPPSLPGLLRHVLYGVYASFQETRAYNPFLWTMGVELVGSMIVFCWLLVLSAARWPAAMTWCAAAFLLACGSPHGLFLVGVGLALWRQQSNLRYARRSVQNGVANCLLLAVVAWHVWSARIDGRFAVSVPLALVLVFACYTHTGVRRWMSTPLSLWLGRVSFPLYLLHFAVIVSFTSAGVIHLHRLHWLNAWSALGLVVASVALSLFLASVFERVEQGLQRRIKARLTGWMLVTQPPSALGPSLIAHEVGASVPRTRRAG